MNVANCGRLQALCTCVQRTEVVFTLSAYVQSELQQTVDLVVRFVFVCRSVSLVCDYKLLS